MENWYNLDNLEASFKEYLLAGIEKTQNNAKTEEIRRETTRKKILTPVSVKNYLSDLRHFFGWLIFKLKVKTQKLNAEEGFLSIFPFLNRQLIEDYKAYLLTNNIPTRTINRRLSTLRKFFSFSVKQGWLKENPAKKISNIKYLPEMLRISKQAGQISNTENSQIIEQFKQDLMKENLDQQTIKSYLEDIREFLNL